jgi:hypothetical protein
LSHGRSRLAFYTSSTPSASKTSDTPSRSPLGYRVVGISLRRRSCTISVRPPSDSGRSDGLLQRCGVSPIFRSGDNGSGTSTMDRSAQDCSKRTTPVPGLSHSRDTTRVNLLPASTRGTGIRSNAPITGEERSEFSREDTELRTRPAWLTAPRVLRRGTSDSSFPSVHHPTSEHPSPSAPDDQVIVAVRSLCSHCRQLYAHFQCHLKCAHVYSRALSTCFSS